MTTSCAGFCPRAAGCRVAAHAPMYPALKKKRKKLSFFLNDRLMHLIHLKMQ
jgi:hypothetical protein